MALEWQFARYINPILAALRELGGSARPGEVYDWAAQHCGVSDAERSIKNKGGNSRFENQVAWARFYLVRSGYLASSQRGVWSLTEQGRTEGILADDRVNELVRKIHASLRLTKVINASKKEICPLSPEATEVESGEEQLKDAVIAETEEATPDDVPRSYRERTLAIMLSLPPQGFERLCQRLLRESGFQQVRVTGRSGDGGIDGIGILQVNPFVSFKILFQCKRWASSVGSPEVRNFRGAMMGRADKGLILTTGVSRRTPRLRLCAMARRGSSWSTVKRWWRSLSSCGSVSFR
jgi:restriction system protein